MKIYKSGYRDHWLSPYTIAEKICFWREIDYSEPWVIGLHTVLKPIMIAIQWFLDKVHPKIDYVKIDYYDTWSMDSTLSPIILAMLKQVKQQKMGCPWTDHADGPWYFRFQTETDNHTYNETGSYNHERWNWIMDEMIWAFEQLTHDNYEEPYWHEYGEIDWDNREADENGLIPVRWKRESVVDWDGLKKHDKAIENGLMLFGKYYRGLWT
jgi:hypothetical protein